MAQSLKSSGILLNFMKLPSGFMTIVELCAASFLINMLALALPIVLMQVYDRIIVYHSKETLTVLVFACSIAIAFECLLRYCRETASAWAGSRFEFMVSNRVFNSNLSTPLDQFSKKNVSEYLQQHSAISMLRTFYTGQFTQSIMDFPFAIIFLIALWYIGGTLVLLPLAIAVSFTFIIIILKPYIEKNHDDQLAEDNKRYTCIFSILSRIFTIKSLTIEEQQLRIAERLQSNSSIAALHAGHISLIPSTIGAIANQIVLFGLIIAGSKHVLDGQLTLGALTACTMFGSRAMQPLQNIAQLWLRYSEAVTAQKKIDTVWISTKKYSLDKPEFPQRIAGRIEAKNITIEGKTPVETLHIKEFICQSKTLSVLTIPTHAGITAFLQMIHGATTIPTGEIFLDEYSLADWNTHDMRRRTSMVLQRSMLFQGTILENITSFTPSNNHLAFDAAGLLGLSDDIARLPKGFETMVDSRGGMSLPTGMVQRIAIARSCVTRPAILLLDHPEVSMGSQDRAIFIEFLQNFKGSCTIVCATCMEQAFSCADNLWTIQDQHLVRSSW